MGRGRLVPALCPRYAALRGRAVPAPDRAHCLKAPWDLWDLSSTQTAACLAQADRLTLTRTSENLSATRKRTSSGPANTGRAGNRRSDLNPNVECRMSKEARILEIR